jgi:hypothetical protein
MRKTLSMAALGVALSFGAVTVASVAAPSVAAAAKAKPKPKPKAKPKAKAKAKPNTTAPGIGSTLVVLNQTKQYEAVTLMAVTDPAQAGDQYLTPNPGDRFVGVTLQIHNRSKGTDTGDANNNTTVVGSNHQVYTADFDPLAGCTDFANGEYTLTTGATEVGCVAFQLPTGVAVAKVQYNPNSGFSTNNATWSRGL